MTLSFTTHWRDELPDFYTSLSPTPLDNARPVSYTHLTLPTTSRV